MIPPHTLHRTGSLPVLDVFGVKVTVLTDGDQNNKACSIAHLLCPPGVGAPPHRHVEMEHFIVLKGSLTVVSGNETLSLQPGGSIHIQPWAPHAFQNTSDTDTEFLAIGTPGGHESFFNDADELARTGRFNPQTAAALCTRHGIELLV